MSAWDIAKPLVDEAIDQDPHPLPRGFSCFPALPRCRCLPRPSPTLPGSSGATARRSGRPGASSTRDGTPCWCWPYLRTGDTFAELAAGFGIGTATAWRYVTETTALLAARAPKLRQALTSAKKAGHAYVVIDGTLTPIDRVAAGRPFYSGKHRRHGMNLQVIASTGGDILWVSGPLPRRSARPDRREDLGASSASWPPPG